MTEAGANLAVWERRSPIMAVEVKDSAGKPVIAYAVGYSDDSRDRTFAIGMLDCHKVQPRFEMKE